MRRPDASLALLYVFLATGHVACAETFHLTREGGVLVLPVQINHSITLNFTIDSGASDVVIPQDVFSTLSRTGTITSKDMLASGTYELADGTRHQARRFRIRSLEIGGLELKDVTASVEPAGGSLLLGQSFLSQLPGWSIDNRRALLIVGDGKKNEDAASPSEIQQAQSEIEKNQKWLVCIQPFGETLIASGDYNNQLAILYPRFGLLWNEWINVASRCTTVIRSRTQGRDVADSDAAQCDVEALERAHMEFVNRVASTAEPDAVRDFNMAQTLARRAISEQEQTCGSLADALTQHLTQQ
jgi:clan AA aspartic protease (TIGR02281 family)